MSRIWLWLGAAIVVEVSATLALKAAVDNPWWYLVVVPGYVLAFVALAVCLRAGMGVGVAYAVWGACGVALTALLSAVFFDEHLSVVTALGILVIIAGVVTVHAGGQRASSPDAIGLQDERT